MRGPQTLYLVWLAGVFALSACNMPDTVAGELTPSVAPVAVMMQESPCWSGPGETFSAIVGLKPGQNVEVTGQTPDGAYLLVRDPLNPTALCWVNAAAATVVGDLAALPTYVAPFAATLVSGCPSPVGGGPTPVDCSGAVGGGCPSPIGGGPTPVICSGAPAAVFGCPSPIGGGPTPVICSGAPAAVFGCPSPIGGGPTPVTCSGSGAPAAVYGCPSPIGGGPTPVSCSGSGAPAAVYGCPSPIGGGPTPVDCSGSGAPPPPVAPSFMRSQPTPVEAPAPVRGPAPVGEPTAVQ